MPSEKDTTIEAGKAVLQQWAIATYVIEPKNRVTPVISAKNLLVKNIVSTEQLFVQIVILIYEFEIAIVLFICAIVLSTVKS